MKTFTQDEVNGLLAQNKKSLQKERDDLARQVQELTALGEAARARVGELETALHTERNARTLAEQKHAELTSAHRDATNRGKVRDALTSASALPDALEHIEPDFANACTFDADEAGHIVAATYKGTRFPKLQEAATAYLKDKPFFLRAPEGGNGHPRSAGGRSNNVKSVEKTPLEIADEGWRAGVA